MPNKHTEKPQKSLGIRISMYVILLGVFMLGIYLLKPMISPKTSVTQTCTYDTDVCSYLSKLQDPAKYYAGPFTVSITTTGANQKQKRVVVRSDAINNLDIITYDENIFTGQSVVIDNIVYKKNLSSNSWTKTNQVVDPALKNIKEQTIHEVNKMGTDVSYTLMGDSKCGKKTCMKYQLITKDPSPVKTYVLFTQTNHMLKEILKYAADGSVIDILFVYTDVTVTPPPTL